MHGTTIAVHVGEKCTVFVFDFGGQAQLTHSTLHYYQARRWLTFVEVPPPPQTPLKVRLALTCFLRCCPSILGLMYMRLLCMSGTDNRFSGSTGVAGGSILCGVLKKHAEIEIRPGIVKKVLHKRKKKKEKELLFSSHILPGKLCTLKKK